MVTIMELHAKLTGSSSEMVKAFKEASKAGEEATRSISEKANAASDSMNKIAVPAGVVAAGTGLIIRDMTLMASEAEQNAGAVESVFKSQAGVIKNFSKSAASDLGISSSEYQKFSGVVGSQLKNLGMPMENVGNGTNDLIKKGADLASMFGGTTSDAVSALSALLRGETDPIERYGVSIKQADVQAKMAAMGLSGLSGEAEKQAKLQATLALLNDQTADATGNFAREADTAAGAQQRATARMNDAKAIMGEAFLPLMTQLADAVSWLSQVLIQHKDILVPLIAIVFGVTAAIATLGIVMKGIAIATEIAAVAWKLLDAAFISGHIGWIVLGVMALIAAFVLLWTNVEWFRNFWISVWDSIVTAAANVWSWLAPIFAAIGQGLMAGLGVAMQVVGGIAVWLWQNVLVPAFSAIGAVIGAFVGFVVAIWPGIMGVFQIFGAIVGWLWNGVIVPAFNGMMTAIGFFANWFMTYVWPGLSTVITQLATIFMWLVNTIIVPIFQTASTVFFWLLNTVVAPVFNGIIAVVGALVNFFVTYMWPVIQTVFQSIGAVIGWLFTNVIGPMFAFGFSVLSGFLDFVINQLGPIFMAITMAIGGVVIWFWETVVVPAFTAIVAVISTAITVIVAVFTWFMDTIVGPVAAVITWLWINIVEPYFRMIGDFIGFVVNLIIIAFNWFMEYVVGPLAGVVTWLWTTLVEPIFRQIGDFINFIIRYAIFSFELFMAILNGPVKAVITWLYETLIRPIFQGIGDFIGFIITGITTVVQGLLNFFTGPVMTIFNNVQSFFSTMWAAIGIIFQNAINWIRDTVVQPFIDFFNGIPAVFEAVKNGIGDIWNGIKEAFAAPVRFVVNTVLNDGIIGTYNSLNDFLSLPDIPRLNLGFASGGYTGDGGKYEPKGVVHGGEYVISKAATSALRRENGMGYLNALNRGITPDNSAFSGPGTRHFKSTGQAKVNPLNGLNIATAARMWDGAAGLGVGAGTGHMSVGTRWGNLGGILAWADMGSNSITFASDGAFPGYSPGWKTAVAAHEIGHTLGLEHINNRGALMNPIVAKGQNPGRPTGIDIAALQALYPGGTGRAGGGAPNGHDDGGGMLGDGIRSLIKELTDKINQAFPGTNLMKDVGIGILNKVGNMAADMMDGIGEFGNDVMNNIKGLFGAGVNQWRDTAKKALEHTNQFSESNLNSLMRRMQQESDGNAGAVNNWDSNANSGTPSKGLMQVIDPTFKAYRDKSLSGDIFDPMANIVAAINYAIARYGSVGTAFNRQGGYAEGGLVPKLFDDGGVLPPGLTLTNNQSGRPEYIMTASDMEALTNGGGGRNITVIVTNPFTGEQVKAKMVEVVEDEMGDVVSAAGRSRGINP